VWGCQGPRKRAYEVALGPGPADGGADAPGAVPPGSDGSTRSSDTRADASTAIPDAAVPSGDAPAGGAEAAGGAPADCSMRTAVGEDIVQNTTWRCGTYVLGRQVWVQDGATLTIEAGSTVVGDPTAAPAAGLFVARGARLLARGQRTRPIVFTSGRPPGSRRPGDWGGLALFGSARINAGRACPATGPGCLETVAPGFSPSDPRAFFGGLEDSGSCGELEFVRIEFAGLPIDGVTEFNALTVAGCGGGTRMSHLQVQRTADDGIELIGGTASLDHVVISDPGDDGLDWNLGWRGTAQFLVIHQQRPDGDNALEGASRASDEAAEPRSAPRIANLTLISNGSPRHRGITFKEGTLGKLTNAIIQGFTFDVVNFVSTTNLATVWPARLSIEHSLFWNNGPYRNDAGGDDDLSFPDQSAVEDPARNNRKDVDPRIVPEPSVPSFVPLNGAVDGVFSPDFGDTGATFAGAFKPRDPAPWTAGWTSYPEQ
jgi:hypothetical protein